MPKKVKVFTVTVHIYKSIQIHLKAPARSIANSLVVRL